MNTLAILLASNELYHLFLYFYFFFFSFLGWFGENIFNLIKRGHLVNRGFLFGPICPIYGIGAIIARIIFHTYVSSPLVLLFYSSFIFSLMEYFISFVLEIIFHRRWWDYSNDLCNINGRINLIFSMFWGLLTVIGVNYVFPFIDRIINYFVLNYDIYSITEFIVLLTLLLAFDVIYSCVKHFEFTKLK